MPTDEQRGFWSAIRANPLDDTPRLVYADWLQEHDDEPRAEFIRLQCEIARLRLSDDRKAERKVLPGLLHRERVLLTTHRERWLEPIFRAMVRSGPGVNLKQWSHSIGFRRGFVADMRLDLDGIHRVMTAGADMEPLQDAVVVIGWEKHNPKKLAEVFAWDGMSCARLFQFRGATDNCVGAIVAGTSAQLMYLVLSESQITDAGASFLANWPCAVSLKYLFLIANRIGDRGAEALASSPYLTNIAELRLEQNPISHLGRQRLISRFGGNVLLDVQT